MITSGPTSAAALADLRAVLDPSRLLTDLEVVEGYRRDEADWAEFGTPLAVVRPRSTAEVAEVVRVCARHGVPIVARGAGTGVSGGANAVDGCVLLCTEQMRTIVEINPAERLAVVQPGVVNDDLRAAAAEHGLWYPPDPSSAALCTIGGNVATNAGGLCCVKYGVTRDYVLALEVVTASGDVVRLGRRTAKGVAGYDLVGLMVGSEGTLGVITEVTVRLRPARSAPTRTVVGFFDSLPACGAAVAGVVERGLEPAVFELIDRHCLAAVNAWKNTGLTEEAAALLLAQIDVAEPAARAEAEAIRAAFVAAGASEALMSTDAVEAEALFAARRLVFSALQERGDPILVEDVCLPRGRLVEMLVRVEEIGVRNETFIANAAHAGDGNLHPMLITPRGDETAKKRSQAAFAEIVDAAIDMGGTVTGEHGVGVLKLDGLRRELGTSAMALQRAVKHALDPLGILNPGKVLG
jgi:glycolate dehydrogenase FAD-linked subunit